jgi:hypothetical protein
MQRNGRGVGWRHFDLMLAIVHIARRIKITVESQLTKQLLSVKKLRYHQRDGIFALTHLLELCICSWHISRALYGYLRQMEEAQ